MSVRIQIRRDSSANWVANNPSLREGEIGIELDTLKIKIGPEPVSGDSTPWNSITNYANLVPSDFDSIINGYVEVNDIGAAGGVVGLNSSKNAIVPGSSIIIEGPTNDSYETTLTVTDPTADRTITLPDATGTIALTSDLPKMTITQVDTNGTATETYSDISTIAFDADSGFDVTNPSTGVAKIAMNSTFKYWEVDGVQKLTAVALDTVNFISGNGIDITADGNADPQSITITGDLTELLPDQNNETGKFLQTDGETVSWATVDLSTKQDKVTGVSDTEIGYLDGVTSAIQTQLNAKSAIDSPTFTGTPAAPTATSGTNTTQIATTAFVKNAVDDLIGNAPGALDTLNELAAAINDDASYAATISTALGNKQDKVTGVSDTEIGYLDGVTSNIQDQINDKISASSTDTLTNKRLTSPKINEDVILTATATELNTLDGITASTSELNVLDGVTASTSEINILDGATLSTTELNYVDGVTSSIQTQLNDKLNSTTASTTYQAIVSGVSDTEIGYLNGVTSAIQDQLDDKAPLASPTFTGTTVVNDLEIGGSLTFSGTATEISSTNTVIEDPLIYLADGNPGNINDLGFVANYNDGTYAHTGLVKDASTGSWKLFKGVTDEPTNTVNFAQGSLDDLEVGGLTATSITVGDVSNTEIGYLNGVTSSIQDQIDDVAAVVPSQTGNARKVLTTDGTSASWGPVFVKDTGTNIFIGTYPVNW